MCTWTCLNLIRACTGIQFTYLSCAISTSAEAKYHVILHNPQTLKAHDWNVNANIYPENDSCLKHFLLSIFFFSHSYFAFHCKIVFLFSHTTHNTSTCTTICQITEKCTANIETSLMHADRVNRMGRKIAWNINFSQYLISNF